MSAMVEIYLREDQKGQTGFIVEHALEFSGNLTFEESVGSVAGKGLCLTFEFEMFEQAKKFVRSNKCNNFHVEGPYDY